MFKTGMTNMGMQRAVPLVPMHPQTLSAIKRSKKGKLPPGLMKYLANKKKGKGR